MRWILLICCLTMIGCSARNGDINRSVDLSMDKSYINPNWQKGLLSPEWYYRLTVVDTPTNTKAASIGEGHWLHPDTIRFEITEKYLIGWRAHASVPGSESDLLPGVTEYKGVPVVVFKIIGHFDIFRGMDTMTRELNNVFDENTSAKVWNKRQFMRVDWTRNLANDFKRQDAYDWDSEGNPAFRDTAHAVVQNDPGNPKRLRFEDGYMEITTRQGVKVDLLAYYGQYGEPYGEDSASPVVDIRMSFMKKPKSDYEPLHYPDFVTLTNSKGQEIRDANQFSVKLPIWEKFGFYRAAFSGQQTWNAQRGSVESGKNYNITRFNIWKQSMRDGVVIPIEKREPKPIIYYLNVHHPDSLLEASRRVEQEWNQNFKELVFYAQPGKYARISDVPDMFILRENSCSLSNVEDWLKKISPQLNDKVLKHADRNLEAIRTKLVESANPQSKSTFTQRHDLESQAKSDLERICSALEFHTQGTDKSFKYERAGDLRYNLLNLVTKRAPTAWSGLGPMLADVLTGEIIQATANINMWYIDRRAALASEQIDIMMGKVPYEDIVMGTDVRHYMNSKLQEIKANSQVLPSKQALNSMNRHFETLAKSGSLLEASSSKNIQDRLAKIAHTPMEQKLFMSSDSGREEDWLLLRKNLKSDLIEDISPARGRDFAQELMHKQEAFAKQSLGIADPPEFLDHLVLGVALNYRDLDRAARFQKIREDVYIATALHEIGHNVGFGHNMAASSDAVNYGKAFWDIQALPKDAKSALAKTQDSKMRAQLTKCVDAAESLGNLATSDCLGQAGTMYSSIMDYHASWNSSLAGLGTYDKAALKFGYAQLLEVFPKKNLKVSEGQNLSKWLFLNDWRRVPGELFVSPEKIHEREHVKYTWGRTSTSVVTPTNEVPYRYCIDSSGAYGPTCKAFDFGPDMRSQAEWNQINYWQYYVLTHFARDRLWSYDVDFQSIISRDLTIFTDFNNIMRWYYYYSATDPDFKGSDAEKDYLAAVVTGLNHYGHVLGHPAPGDHVSTPVHMVESLMRSSAGVDRLQPSSILLPWGSVDACTRLNVSELKEDRKRVARPGFVMANVPLGDGRPFYVGLNHDYEEWHVNFVGSFYSKLYAGFFLAYPGAWFPRTDSISDPRFYNINWYRLFPNEVGKLFRDMISQNWSEFGFVIDENNVVKPRNIVEPNTLMSRDYNNSPRVLPSSSTFLPYRAMYFASAMMSGYRNSEMDMLKSMRVTLEGSSDDISILNSLSDEHVSSFIHPISGYRYRAMKTGDYPIAYDLVKRLNVLKEKYARLDTCVKDETARKNDSYCQCVRTSMPKPYGGAICCHPANPDCSSIGLQTVGGDSCSMRDLMQRRDKALEDLDDAASFLDDMRWFVNQYSNMP